jgi:hypothetical protein
MEARNIRGPVNLIHDELVVEGCSAKINAIASEILVVKVRRAVDGAMLSTTKVLVMAFADGPSASNLI